MNLEIVENPQFPLDLHVLCYEIVLSSSNKNHLTKISFNILELNILLLIKISLVITKISKYMSLFLKTKVYNAINQPSEML